MWSLKAQLGSFDCLVQNSLDSVGDATLSPLKKRGLLGVETVLLHASGSSVCPAYFSLGLQGWQVNAKEKHVGK